MTRIFGIIENVTAFANDGSGPFVITMSVIAMTDPSPHFPSSRIMFCPIKGSPEVCGCVLSADQAAQASWLLSVASTACAEIERKAGSATAPRTHETVDDAKMYLFAMADATKKAIGRSSKQMDTFVEAVRALPDMKFTMLLERTMKDLVVRELGKVRSLQAAP